jgi:pyridoxine 4-dehydrogenase
MIIPSNFSTIGIGTSHLASLGSRLSFTEADKLFAKALESNVTLIDTSDTYGSGDAERLIGRSIQENRDNFFIMTKAGFPFMALPNFLSPLNQIGKKMMQKGHAKKKYSKKYIVSSLQGSLKRLKTDYVDAFVLHEPSAEELLEYHDCWEGLNYIKESGMAKYIGISTNDTEAFKLANANVKLDIVQTAMFVPTTKVDTVFSLCKSELITTVANQVLRPNRNLLLNNDFKKLLVKYNKKDDDLVAILIAYAHFFKKSDCVLIGTRNHNHLANNVLEYKKQEGLNEIFEAINKISL